MAKKKSPSISSYVADAKALAGRGFPAAKKYTKRKTLKPSEKAAITRMRNRALAGEFPKAKKTDADYRKIAREANKELAPNARMKMGRKKLTPQQKGNITRKSKEARAAKFATKLTEAQFKKIPKRARFSKNTRAIKIRETLTDAQWKIKRVNNDGSIVAESNRRTWHLEPVNMTGDVEIDADALIEAGRKAFAKGAEQINFWFWNGVANAGHPSLTRWTEAVFEFLAEYGDDGKFIIGIAWTDHIVDE